MNSNRCVVFFERYTSRELKLEDYQRNLEKSKQFFDIKDDDGEKWYEK